MGLFAVDHEHRPTDPSADGCCLGKSQCLNCVSVLLMYYLNLRHGPPSRTGSSSVFLLAYSKRFLHQRKTQNKQAVIDLLNQTSLHVSNMKRQQTSLWLEAEDGEERKG